MVIKSMKRSEVSERQSMSSVACRIIDAHDFRGLWQREQKWVWIARRRGQGYQNQAMLLPLPGLPSKRLSSFRFLARQLAYFLRLDLCALTN